MGFLLNQKLGPEYLSTRQGPGGSKLTYMEGWRSISLANEVFGFNGWSSAVRDISIDFVCSSVKPLAAYLRLKAKSVPRHVSSQLDYSEETGRWNVHVTALVRITLPDGCYHEDVGCGKMDNCKSKADALDKVCFPFLHYASLLITQVFVTHLQVKKEAVTDAIKRALRNFGNLMGNCIYDKNFLNDIAKVKAPGKVPLDFATLHRPGQEYDEEGKLIKVEKSDASKPPAAGPSNAAMPNTGNQQPNQNLNKPTSNNAAQIAPRQNAPPVQNRPQMPAQKAPQQLQPNQQRPNQYQPQIVQQGRPNPPQTAGNAITNQSVQNNQNKQNSHVTAQQARMQASTSAAVHLRQAVGADIDVSLNSEDMLYEGMEDDESIMQGAHAKYDDSGFEEGTSMIQAFSEAAKDVSPSRPQQQQQQQQQPLQPRMQNIVQHQQQPLRPPQSAANPPVQAPRPVMQNPNGPNRAQAPQQAAQSMNPKQEQHMNRMQMNQVSSSTPLG